LTPFINCIISGIDDDHNARPALSHVGCRSFEQWTDRDMEAFPGLATGIGALFQDTWHSYGDLEPTLTTEERVQRTAVAEQLRVQLSTLEKKNSPRAIEAALRELLRSMQQRDD